MTSQKQRKIPVQVSFWSQKDTTIHKPMVDPGTMPKHTRFNILSSRKLYDDLINLSFERYGKIARHDHERKMFLNKQRQKAQKSMPGLLPYVDPFKDEIDDVSLTSFSSNRSEQFTSPSLQSFRSNSFVKSDIFFQPEKPLILPKISNKSVDDKRFKDLIELFGDAPKKNSISKRSIQTIIQSKESLQRRSSVNIIEDHKMNATLFDAYV